MNHTQCPCFSVLQRLQRFSTYGHLKQMVLKMIVDEMASPEGKEKAAAQKLALQGVDGVSPTLIAGLTVGPGAGSRKEEGLGRVRTRPSLNGWRCCASTAGCRSVSRAVCRPRGQSTGWGLREGG